MSTPPKRKPGPARRAAQGRSAEAATGAPANGASARDRIIEATIASILEQGFYRASTNAIAQRAGLTWGVIQYYFGSRERLMVEVLKAGMEDVGRLLEKAVIDAPTLEGRLAQFLDVMKGHYGAPSYLAYVQIMLNLAHDPRTSEETAQAMADANTRVRGPLSDLLGQVLPEGSASEEIRGAIFHACRGLALSQLVLDATTPEDVARRQGFRHYDSDARMLVTALGMLVGSGAAAE